MLVMKTMIYMLFLFIKVKVNIKYINDIKNIDNKKLIPINLKINVKELIIIDIKIKLIIFLKGNLN